MQILEADARSLTEQGKQVKTKCENVGIYVHNGTGFACSTLEQTEEYSGKVARSVSQSF